MCDWSISLSTEVHPAQGQPPSSPAPLTYLNPICHQYCPASGHHHSLCSAKPVCASMYPQNGYSWATAPPSKTRQHYSMINTKNNTPSVKFLTGKALAFPTRSPPITQEKPLNSGFSAFQPYKRGFSIPVHLSVFVRYFPQIPAPAILK